MLTPRGVVRANGLDQAVVRELVPLRAAALLGADQVRVLELANDGFPVGLRSVDDLRAKAVLGDQRLAEPGADLAFVRPGAFGHGADLGGVEVAERVVDTAERDDVGRADLVRLRVQGLPELPARDLQLHRFDARSGLERRHPRRAALARAGGRRRAAPRLRS